MKDVIATTPISTGATVARSRPDPIARMLLMGLVLLLGLCLSPYLFGSAEGQRALMAVCVFGGLMVFIAYSPNVGIPAMLVFLCILGELRRWLIPIFGWVPSDPLLLACPLIATLYFANLLIQKRLPADRLSRLLLVLMGVMALEIVNPAQGGLAVGIAGALFYIVPLFWYFLGTTLGSPAILRRLFVAVIVIAVLATLYGFYQTAFGFSDAELQWMKLSGMGALNVGSTVRALSFFTSPAEYITFDSIAIALLWAAFLRGYRAALLLIPLFVVAIFLESSRGALVNSLAACTGLWAVQGRRFNTWVPRGLLAVVIAIVGTVWSLQQVQQVHFSDQTQALISHETNGILNITDDNQSTAGLHTNMMLGGIAQGFTQPLGQGLGSTTLAAAKFSDVGGSTEVDYSNMFVSLGCVGGLLYLGIILVIFALALTSWQRDRSMETLGVLAILFALFGQWLTGEYYAGALLLWFSVGTLTRMALLADKKKKAMLLEAQRA